MSVLKKALLAPFLVQERLSRELVALFVLINCLILVNAVLHEPRIGYDGESHLKNVAILATGRLPTSTDSREFFSPPLPYVFPAALTFFGLPLRTAAKCAQLLNGLLSLGLTFYLLKLCEVLRPASKTLELSSLTLLGLLPVYYKSFAFIRGEPYLAFLTVFAAYQVLLIAIKGEHSPKRVIAVGVTLGAMALARQWAFALFPALLVFLGLVACRRVVRSKVLIQLALASLLGPLAISGWFYLHLYLQYGTIAAFNRGGSPSLSLSNQPPDFYLGLGLPVVFERPVRSAFPNQLVPLFYAETWGDYWGYFTVRGTDSRTGEYVRATHLEKYATEEPPPDWLQTNRHTMSAYLGRVNRVSLFPTLLLLVGLGVGVIRTMRSAWRR
ncbi:MAG: hypothetical protein ACUVWR_18995 [Anaerolineae bacterium]